jgi:hypothetical protein
MVVQVVLAQHLLLQGQVFTTVVEVEVADEVLLVVLEVMAVVVQEIQVLEQLTRVVGVAVLGILPMLVAQA